MEDIYHPEVDIECLKDYVPGGYHPTLIGDTFCSGRYTVVHKLAFGGYSTIWLARDQQRRGYVSLKILTARASSDSHEGEVLHRLMKGSHAHSGKRFIPPLLGQFSFHGLNGYHQCLVEEPSSGSIAYTNFKFPPDAVRSIVAQLLLGLSCLHVNGICHGRGDNQTVHTRRSPFAQLSPTHTKLNSLSTTALYERFGKPYEVPIRRVNGKPGEPHAPRHAIYPVGLSMPANEVDTVNHHLRLRNVLYCDRHTYTNSSYSSSLLSA
ncbi:kinase domain-containing protein [Penicillium expansum]|nr:kinase domain-containing protein [Penicillium expansum]